MRASQWISKKSVFVSKFKKKLHKNGKIKLMIIKVAKIYKDKKKKQKYESIFLSCSNREGTKKDQIL